MATTVEVITSPDCIKSGKAVRIVREVASKISGVLLYEVTLVSEAGRQYAASLCVKSTPALVVNGKVAYEGLMKKEKAQELIMLNSVSK